MTTDVAVLTMAKAPRAGQVKTRLQPLLGPDGCARLQAALILRTVLLARQVAPASTYLALDPPDEAPVIAPVGVRILRQRGAHLGARMANAVHDVLAEQPRPVLVIGTDAPTLSAAHLRDAARRLGAGPDAVFGPALDGGYYLIGMRDAAPELFAIEPGLWGGPDVLSASEAAARAAGLRTTLTDPLRDLDTPDDAAVFLREGGLAADIAGLLTAEVTAT